MALLAEELVEEWLNRQGYFTMRGVKLGVQEMDLLAVRFLPDGNVQCRHVEVQVSINPQGYFTRLTHQDQRATGHGGTSKAKRTREQIGRAVDEWTAKKFGHADKLALLRQLAPGDWTKELVVHKFYDRAELECVRSRGITIHAFTTVLRELASTSTVVRRASGSDLLELVFLGAEFGEHVEPPVIAEAAAKHEAAERQE